MAEETQNNQLVATTQELLGIKISYKKGAFAVNEVKNIKGYLPNNVGASSGYSFNIVSSKGETIYSVIKRFPEMVFSDDLVNGKGSLRIKDPSESYMIFPAPEYAKDLVIKDGGEKEVTRIDLSKYIKKTSTTTVSTKPKSFFAKSLPYVGISLLIVVLVAAVFVVLRRRR